MEINKAVLECMIVFLYKIEQFDACAALLDVLKTIEAKENVNWAVRISPKEENIH